MSATHLTRARWPALVRHSLWLLIVPAGLAAESVLNQSPSYIVYDLAVGLTSVFLSLAVWESRPSNRLGPLLFAYTAWFVLSPVRFIPNPAWISVSWVVQALMPAVFVHIVLSYPSGRLGTRLDRALVAGLYVYGIGLSLLQLMVAPAQDLFCGCAAGLQRPPLLFADESLFRLTMTIGSVVLPAALLIVYLLLGRRCVQASHRERRRMWPIIAVAVVAGLNALMRQFVPASAGGPWDPADIGDHVVTLGLAATLLAGFYTSSVERSHIADLLGRIAGARVPAIEPLLAQTLHDRELRVGVWDGDRGLYVTADGTTLTTPAGDRQRVLTTINSEDGSPLGALMHERSLLDEPQLASSIEGAVRLALENDQLTARVAAQLAEVRASRARIVEVGDDERRRLERDLHDGAQQRLLAIGMALQLARGGVDPDGETANLLAEAEGELEAALGELRQLARGIHPAVLTDQGLAGAVKAAAARTPIPVDVLAVPAGRLPDRVEKAAYFVVCEALQNVTKHSRAQRARVSITQDDGHLRVEVDDDGVGGVRQDASGGLRGLRDRVEAVDGKLMVESNPGRGTTVRAVLPCEC